MNKQNTYFDKLLTDKKFKDDFEKEYKNLIISEKKAILKRNKLANLKRCDVLVGNPEDFVHVDWSNEWKG